MKSDLLANVSHELRTPLTAIKGYTDYILERKLGAITDKQEKGLVVVQRNLERLSRTINALLDFSRMDMGRITLNLAALLAGPAGGADPDHPALGAGQEAADASWRAWSRTCRRVIADREKLSAVIENLVINAIKFTPEGGSHHRVRAAACAGGRAPDGARSASADTGIGIPRDQIGKIFNRFHQVDGSTTRRFGGVGLGLAIVKSILDAHGAAIQVESEEGKGTASASACPCSRGRSDRPPTTRAAARTARKRAWCWSWTTTPSCQSR